MKKSVFIASVMSNIDLPKTKLENAANKQGQYNRSVTYEDVAMSSYENFSWRFLNTPVSGNVEMVFANNATKEILCVDVPVSTSFLAICTKGDLGNFELQFGISLS